MRGIPCIICRGTGHDILDFFERERVTLSGGGVEKKMAIVVLVNRQWDHLYLSRANRTIVRRQNMRVRSL